MFGESSHQNMQEFSVSENSLSVLLLEKGAVHQCSHQQLGENDFIDCFHPGHEQKQYCYIFINDQRTSN